MSLLAWVVLGIVAGFVASKITAGGFILDVVLTIAGGAVGLMLHMMIGATAPGELNGYAFLTSIAAAMALLIAYRSLIHGDL